jgi:hypothetical protein
MVLRSYFFTRSRRMENIRVLIYALSKQKEKIKRLTKAIQPIAYAPADFFVMLR